MGLLAASPYELLVERDALGIGDPRRVVDEAAIAANDGAVREVELAPPGDVGGVAECADHCDASSLFGIGQRMSEHGHFNAEQRCLHRDLSEQRLVALVGWMGHQCNTRGQQLRPGGVDDDVGAAVGAMERNVVIRAADFAVFHLGLGNGSFVVDVPQRWSVLCIRLAALQVAQKCALAGAARVVVDSCVQQRPVV